MLALNRNKDTWVCSRSLSKALKREKYLFVTGSLPYDDAETSFIRFVASTKALMIGERAGCAKLVSLKVDAGESVSPPAAGEI